jgi:uncharacterized protein YjbI with pentapeptide repeats
VAETPDPALSRRSLSADEVASLSTRPPTDAEGRPTEWSIVDAKVTGATWSAKVEHERVTLRDIDFTGTEWTGPTLRQSAFHNVSFLECTLTEVRFSDVLFDGCSFEVSTFDQCEFERCRFTNCDFCSITFLRTPLAECRFEDSALIVADLYDSDLNGSHFVKCELQGLRLTRVTASTLSFERGLVRGTELTSCRFETFKVRDAEVQSLRIYDCTIGTAAFANNSVVGVEMSGGETGTLSFTDCAAVPGLRLLRQRIGDLIFDACAVPSPFIAGTTVVQLLIRGSKIFDAAFERVEVTGCAAIEGGTLAGVFFDRGRWARLFVTGISLTRYVTATGVHFENLRLEGAEVADDLALRCDGDSYGAGSATWEAVHGA